MARLLDKLTFLDTVYMKPHPTIGISKFLKSDKRVKIKDETTLASMINLTHFRLIVGIESTALKEVRHINVVLVIDSFTFANNAVKLNFKRCRAQSLSATIFERKLLHAQPLHPTPNRGTRIDSNDA